MLFLSEFISSTISAVFFYYILTIMFRQKSQGKIAIPIYILYTAYQGYFLYQIGLIYLITGIPYLLFLTMMFNYYELSVFKKRSSQKFLRKTKTELFIMSQKYKRKIEMFIGIISIQIIFIVLMILKLQNVLEIKWYYLVFLESFSFIFVYRYFMIRSEQIILIIGNKERKVYQMPNLKLKNPINQVLTDQMYIADQSGIIILETGIKRDYYHVLTVLMDQIDYEVPSHFSLIKNEFINEIKDEFKRYEYSNKVYVYKNGKYQRK
ncbi:MAG: hypothetical protein GX312_00090 [Candidatus Phytoplasma sp.]|nr:hypothetical protein [Phytoplasma sp.]